MSTPPRIQVNNPYAHIGMQVVAEQVFFGGTSPDHRRPSDVVRLAPVSPGDSGPPGCHTLGRPMDEISERAVLA
jgi:hypothetical protein